jgi:hypothetical protein
MFNIEKKKNSNHKKNKKRSHHVVSLLKTKICNMSISFTCLFLVYLSLSRFSFEKKTKSNLFFRVVCVFLKETCVENKGEKKGDGIPCMFFSLYVFMVLSIYLSTFFCELLLCSKLCFLFFVFYAVTITAAAAVFLYLFIKRLCVCVCVSAFIICCVFTCVRAVHSFYFVVFFFRLLKKLPNLFTTLKKPTVILSFFFCVLVCSSYLHGCCVCVWFFFC